MKIALMNHILSRFLSLWLTVYPMSSCPTAYRKYSKYRPFVRTQASRMMLSPFIDNSVDNVLLQSLLEFINITKQRPIDSLLHDTANIVSERTVVRAVGGHRSREMKFIDLFRSFQCTLCLFCFLQVTDAGCGGNLNSCVRNVCI